MQDFERLGLFYLGREVSPEGRKDTENLILYDARDLVTHAVCVGMTGSGKTGLGVTLLEEAAIDGIPSIVIDPKGDMANLMLTFPRLTGEDFSAWVDPGEAARKNMSAPEYAKEQAETWKKGLASWGQDGDRILRFESSVERVLYTPGSSSGIPLSILHSFAVPEGDILRDGDLFSERVTATVTGLLNLLGIEADPIRSPEFIFLSTFISTSWKSGRSLDLAALIEGVQHPPFTRLGVFELEAFYPAKDRFELATRLNGLLASPDFSSWLEGPPLDVRNLLWNPSGKPRMSILSIAHLNDAERMFFVTLLLTQIVGWMRSQSGTGSLRAILYMDEVFGYLPPVANPPSKPLFLTLLKQARAYGLGLVLATQNPADLDYKALSNAGTWFIGRLQTERDKTRLLDGLEGVRASEGGRYDRQSLDGLISGLGKRVFLMNNIHEEEPVLFQTRWALSYLRGPMTREELRTLTQNISVTPEPVGKVILPEKPAPPPGPEGMSRPSLDPAIPQVFLPPKGQFQGSTVTYAPSLVASGSIYYADGKAGVALEHPVFLLTEIPDEPSMPDWEKARAMEMKEEDLLGEPEDGARFLSLPSGASDRRAYPVWERDCMDWLYRNAVLTLKKNPTLGLISRPGESESDFLIRQMHALREWTDRQMDELRRKFDVKRNSLENKIQRTRARVEREKDQAGNQKVQTAISLGATLLGALMGRKKISTTTLGRATTAARGMSRSRKEAQDVKQAEKELEDARKDLQDLENEMTSRIDEIRKMGEQSLSELESYEVRPLKKNISIRTLALAWIPR